MKLHTWLEGVAIGAFSLATLIDALIALAICYGAIKILTKLLRTALSKSKKLEPTVRSFISSGIRIGLWVVAIVIVAETLGIPTASLVAVISVAGLALSLSIQGTMTNLFSGLTLLITKPFSVNDFIEINDMCGTVRSITLFYTVIETRDRRTISIPNGDVSAASVVNWFSAPVRRVDIKYTASYDAPTETVKKALAEAAAQVPCLLDDPKPLFYISAFLDSSIEYTCNLWCHPEDYWAVITTLNEHVRDAFEANGVEMTYNHLNVHLDCPQQTPGEPKS